MGQRMHGQRIQQRGRCRRRNLSRDGQGAAQGNAEGLHQGGKGADLVHFFNEDGLGAIINSSRGIIAAYQQEKYAKFGAANYAEASRQAVIDMREDIAQALAGAKA